MADTLSKRVRVDNLVTPQDVAQAGTVNTNTGGYRNMRLYSTGMVVVTAYLTDAATAVAQLTQSSAATAAGKANVTSKTVTLTGTAAARNQVGTIDFNADDLAIATQYVGVDITTDGAGDDVQAVLVRDTARYQETTMKDE